MHRVLILTGTCGSGKSTIAQTLADAHGWVRVSEDVLWESWFENDRGVIGTEEHFRKRAVVRREVAKTVGAATRERDVVIDATVHDSDPSSIAEYERLFRELETDWQIRVLHPPLEVAIERDAGRQAPRVGALKVERLWRKFTGQLFDERIFLDTRGESAPETASRVLKSLSRDLPTSTGAQKSGTYSSSRSDTAHN